MTPEKIIAKEANASIKLHFYAGKVFAVMGKNADKAIKVNLLLDGKRVKKNTSFDVIHHGLYALIAQKRAIDAELEVIATEPGLEIYTFTFGN